MIKIDYLHKKVSVYLVNKYKNIHLGKISTSNVISNKKGNLKEITKRRIKILSYYKFNEIIKKWQLNIKVI